jgi:regulator of protease activity HflC (stomatin/prohibitin superfamily)
MSQVQLVEARAKAEVQKLDAQANAENLRVQAEARARAEHLHAQSRAEVNRIRTQAEVDALAQRETAAAAHPALLRLEELRALRELAGLADPRIYIGFDKHSRPDL